uniref:Uncharacterized protein n=1 Tax=Fagus sylvatica TaxID=28930 RepID=A0A2N9FVC7_FAGSY
MEGSQSFVEHPYIPRDLKLPGFVPGVLSQSTIVGVYAVSSLLVVSLIWVLSGCYAEECRSGNGCDIFSYSWIPDLQLIVDKTGFYLAEVWKEYSKGDSRYAARDAGVVTVEGLTAVLEGPASLLAV